MSRPRAELQAQVNAATGELLGAGASVFKPMFGGACAYAKEHAFGGRGVDL